MTEKIIILDFGSQVTQLIGRRLRELNVFCEIYPYNKCPELSPDVKGIVLSGSPCSVLDANAPQIDLTSLKGKLPLLGICYGAQYLAHKFGGLWRVLAGNTGDAGSRMRRLLFQRCSRSLRGLDVARRQDLKLPDGAVPIASAEDVGMRPSIFGRLRSGFSSIQSLRKGRGS